MADRYDPATPATGYTAAPTYDQSVDPGYGHSAGPLTRPGPLSTAVKLMWALAALSLVAALLQLVFKDQVLELTREALEKSDVLKADEIDKQMKQSESLYLPQTLVGGLIGTALWAWMAAMNAKGKKWARIVATVLGVLAVLGVALSFIAPNVPAILAVEVLMGLLALAMLVFLWNKQNRPFYEASSVRR